MDPFLKKLGASPQRLASIPDPSLQLGRVNFHSHDLYRLFAGGGQEVLCTLVGRLRRSDSPLELPCVGDWVLFRPTDAGHGKVAEVLPRQTILVRQSAGDSGRPQALAANVDWAFVVTSMDGDFNEARLERYLSLIAAGGARPALLLTKVDVAADPDRFLRAGLALLPGGPVLALSARSGQGLAAFQSLVAPFETAVFLGSSGVGKSTLINSLLGRQVQVTQETRVADAKGRHTTTARHLLLASGDRVLIDTPGMRELQLDAEAVDLSTAFPEIIEIISQCRFTDCGHQSEPDCAINAALHDGQLDAARWESYLKLEREQIAARRKTQQALASRSHGQRGRRGY